MSEDEIFDPVRHQGAASGQDRGLRSKTIDRRDAEIAEKKFLLFSLRSLRLCGQSFCFLGIE